MNYASTPKHKPKTERLVRKFKHDIMNIWQSLTKMSLGKPKNTSNAAAMYGGILGYSLSVLAFAFYQYSCNGGLLSPLSLSA